MNLDRVIAVRNQKTVYRDGDRCIKVFHTGYSKADILGEALSQARMEDEGLCVPRVLEVATVDGKWAIVSEYVRGKTLAQKMKEEPEKREEHLALLVRLQMTVHGKSCPLLPDLKNKLALRLAEAVPDTVARDALSLRLAQMPAGRAVCHGDLTPQNIILTSDGTPYLLDWSHATVGDSTADMARSYLLLWLAGDAPLAEDYLSLVTRMSGTERQAVLRWIPLLAAAQSVRSNEGERERLHMLLGEEYHQ